MDTFLDFQNNGGGNAAFSYPASYESATASHQAAGKNLCACARVCVVCACVCACVCVCVCACVCVRVVCFW
jgi:hypothetical protein